jgi:hypothetical protein
MYAVVENGKVVGFPQVNQPFECNGKRSSQFLQSATEQECLDIGLYHYVDALQPDWRFYWESKPTYTINEETKTVTQSWPLNPKIMEDRLESDKNGNPMYVKVWDATVNNGENQLPGAMVDSDVRLVTKGLKTIWSRNIKLKVRELLAPTDAKVMDETITEEESTKRATIITEGNRLDTAISTASNVEDLINILNTQNWPKLILV